MTSSLEMLKLPNLPLWHQEASRRPTLQGDSTCDVAIVGAGYSGLWTAYYLLKAKPGLRITIIEREHVGFGASGRNGGWASAIFPISLQRVAKFSSHADALRLQATLNETVDEIGRVLALEGIDADYAKQGVLSLARSEAQLRRVVDEARESADFGLSEQWQLLDARSASAMTGAQGVRGGLYSPHCALIHPGKLVHGLARLVESLGAMIHEATPATDIGPRSVTTPHGRLSASFVLRATEAFTCQQQGEERSVLPLYSLVIATEPLPAELRRQLGLDHRRAFNDMRHLRVYAQMTADGRLVFGGRGAPYRLGSKMSSDLVDAIHTRIHETATGFFPALRGFRITHRWGGALGVARDFCPSVGLDEASGIARAGGYLGDGVATSNLAGRILCNLILKRDEPINRLPIVNRRSPRWEREPLRWLGVNAALAATRLGDIEERLTDRPSRVAGLLATLTGAH
jgi:glycine/D-amino acid oxidase-like deaminating enzyme